MFNYCEGFIPPSSHLNWGRDVADGRGEVYNVVQDLLKHVPDTAKLDASENLLPMVVTKYQAAQLPDSFNLHYMILDLNPHRLERYPNVYKMFLKETSEGKCHVIDYNGYFAVTGTKPVSNEKTREFVQKLTNRFEVERQKSNYAISDYRMEEYSFEASNFLVRTIRPDYNNTYHKETAALAYGPYIKVEPGNYNVVYRLKTDNTDGQELLATLDVTGTGSNGLQVFGTLQIHPSDFKKSGTFQDFIIPLRTATPLENTEFRIFYSGTGVLSADFIELIPE